MTNKENKQMKTITLTLTEDQVNRLDELMCFMSDAMNDVDETRPGGIISTPQAFKRYVPKALKGWQILHDLIMDEIFEAIRKAKGEG